MSPNVAPGAVTVPMRILIIHGTRSCTPTSASMLNAVTAKASLYLRAYVKTIWSGFKG